MRGRVLAPALFVVFACSAGAARGWTVPCGQVDQPSCKFNDARFEGKQGGLCPAGQFFDLIEGGTCWTCPSGYGRTVFAVNTDKACEKVSSLDFRRAIENAKGTGFFSTDCLSGQFWDIVDFKCHSCPSGYAMQVLEHVHGDRKCAKTIPGAFAKATRIGPPCGAGKLWDPRNGGECWSCPEGFKRTIAPVNTGYACEHASLLGGTGVLGCQAGLVSIRGTCRQLKVCGKQGQRPCEIPERVPSCDDGLKEDFKQNLCVPLLKGETPFTGGLSSLAGYLGAALQAQCKQLLGGGGSALPVNGDLGIGLTCARDAGVGFACALARDVATGYPDLLNGLMEKVPAGASLADQMNAAAIQSPCKELGERFAKTTLHGKATGTVMKVECPAGQFWDPDGNCYSCPKDYTRTFFPVTDARACTDKVGGNLARFACGAYKGVEQNFTSPLKCTVEVLENGSIFERKVDLSKANQLVCTATGELGYYIVRTGIEAGKAVATGDISGVLTTIGKVKSSAVNALDLKRLMECRNQKP